jgi:hypothetical protein
MVWIRNKSGYSTEQCEWFNLQMGGGRNNIGFVECDIRVIFFIDVEILNQALPEEVIECDSAFLEKL